VQAGDGRDVARRPRHLGCAGRAAWSTRWGWAPDLPANNGVIRAQWPTAMTILVIDIGLLRFLLPKP